MNGTNLVDNRIASLLLLVGVLLFPVRSAFAFPEGISGYSGQSGSVCTVCHSSGAEVPMVTLAAESGMTMVEPDSVTGYVLTMVGGPAVDAGLDVAADGGVLIDTNAAGTKILNGELTHSSPNAVAGGMKTWTFDWEAPSTEGTYFLDAAVLSANGTGGTGGDGTGTAMLMLEVVPEPSASLLAGTALVSLLGMRVRNRL